MFFRQISLRAFVVPFVLALASCGAAARGATFYTVNNLADTLVALDPTSGKATPIGPIGFDMFEVDLTLMNGTVYGVTSNSADVFGQPGWTLVAMSPQTGAMTSKATLSYAGKAPNVVESIAALDGKLYIGFASDDSVSREIGVLDPVTGVITNAVNYSKIPGANNLFGSFGVDIDGLSGESGGSLLAVDGDASLVSLVRIDPLNVTVAGVKQFEFVSGINDVGVTQSAAYLIGETALYKLDLSSPNPNPVIQTLPFSPLGSYRGLAVPEPTGAILIAIGAGLTIAAHVFRARWRATSAR